MKTKTKNTIKTTQHTENQAVDCNFTITFKHPRFELETHNVQTMHEVISKVGSIRIEAMTSDEIVDMKETLSILGEAFVWDIDCNEVLIKRNY